MLSVPPSTRIPIGVALVGGQQVEFFLNPEWARYFESLNTQVATTSSAVGQPGAPGTTGAAGVGVSLSDDTGGDVEFIPGPPGQIGQQGTPGSALFLLQEQAESRDFMPPSTQLNETFIAPTLLNSWVYFGSPYNPVGYFKDAAGIVHLRGTVKSGTATPSVIFTLPAGYRPANQEMCSVTSNNAAGRVDVLTTGDVQLVIGTNAVVSLDGLTFRAAGTY